MEPSHLELLPTEQLIEELTRRTTFLGVVVHAEQEMKSGGWGPERVFKVKFNANLSNAQVSRLLERVADYIDDCCSDPE